MRGLAWCAVLAALIVGNAEARTRTFTANTIAYLGSSGGPTITRTVTLSAAASDSILSISYYDQGYSWPDTLGDGVSMWFEWTPTSSGTTPTLKLYLYGNTRLNGADTLDTTPYDSTLVQAGGHTGDRMALDRVWKVKVTDGGGGGKLSYGVQRKPGWFQW